MREYLKERYTLLAIFALGVGGAIAVAVIWPQVCTTVGLAPQTAPEAVAPVAEQQAVTNVVNYVGGVEDVLMLTTSTLSQIEFNKATGLKPNISATAVAGLKSSCSAANLADLNEKLALVKAVPVSQERFSKTTEKLEMTAEAFRNYCAKANALKSDKEWSEDGVTGYLVYISMMRNVRPTMNDELSYFVDNARADTDLTMLMRVYMLMPNL
jgi:hypothetical protein